ncbi:hypothetical protein MNBD_NITROSPINAE02-608 [hydrothermal vent metagenome]|uniref:Uncharacterized protein n=1 Tax=hydrothermal vent metagenome TaxID=652676 RepID=A0A3B1C5P3_9ZZZZ
MKFIEEKVFLEMMELAGIASCDDGRSLRYKVEDGAQGFDFTNLALPDKPMAPYEVIGGGDRSVEYAMVSTVFKIFEALKLFPLYLYTIDDEWAAEELDPLVKKGLLTPEEGEILNLVADEDHNMDVVMIEREDLAVAVRLIAPQFTIFQTSCAVTDAKGRALILFSPDDEVSFNTKDKDIYEKASRMVKSLENLPFETIWADSY